MTTSTTTGSTAAGFGPEFAQLLRDQGPDPVAADHDGCDDEETSEADDISRR